MANPAPEGDGKSTTTTTTVPFTPHQRATQPILCSSPVPMCRSFDDDAKVSKQRAEEGARNMQLHISPSLRHVTVLPSKGVREFIKVRVASRRVSYRLLFYSLLALTFLLRFVFVITAVDTIDGEAQCSTLVGLFGPFLGCMGQVLGPRLWGRRLDSSRIPEEVIDILEAKDVELPDEVANAPQSLEEFLEEMKRSNKSDAKAFARKLKAMITLLEQKTRTAKIHEYLYRHVASSSIPKPLHCLALHLADEYATNAEARLPLPSPEQVPSLVDNSLFHFVLASDNVLAASVVAASVVRNALHPDRVVVHVVTDRKTFAAMHAWFSLHRPDPAAVEVKAIHHFEWFTRGRVPVLEAMEKDRAARAQFRGGSAAIVSGGKSDKERPVVVAAKLQALSPKYNSIMNHIRINLPEMFPSLKKVVFLDDDVVVQADLLPLWDIDLHGKVNGAVETCRGKDRFVMSKRLRSYLNFSHPEIARRFDPKECAWAYGMNVFDLDAWRKTNISQTYHYWVDKNLKSDLSLWQLGTLPPGLIAFRGHIQPIDPYWHMLGLGYQENTSLADAQSAAVVHFNGRAKPWLDIAFPELRALWSKYVDFSDRFVRACNIRAST